jgi:hypothetical protein
MTMRKTARLVSLLALGLVAHGAQAADDVTTPRASSTGLFGGFEENFLVYNAMKNGPWARADESAIRAHYSLKYVFWPYTPAPAHTRASDEEVKGFVSYTGEFDFYARTRPSSPVINRLSQPGLHVQVPLRRFSSTADPLDAVELSLEHRSNGQVVEITSPAEAAQAEQAYASRDRGFFDTISRGSNFLGLALVQNRPFGLDRLYLKVKARAYLNQDSEITWGPLKGRGETIRRYDLLNLRLRYATDRFGAFEAKWTVGSGGVRTDAWTLGWIRTRGDNPLFLPLYARLHLGPMNTLSNYAQRQDSFGIGLRFTND